MHCRGQTKGNTEEAVGNRLADQAAKAPAKKQDSPKAIVSPLISSPLSTQDYQPAKEEWARRAQASRTSEGLWRLPDGRVYVPQGQAVQVVENCHVLTHLGKTALENLLRRYLYIPNLATLCASIAARCVTCAKNNTAGNNRVPPGIQHRGTQPLEDLQIDFTEVKPSQGYKYLLILICTFSGWAEAFPGGESSQSSTKGNNSPTSATPEPREQQRTSFHFPGVAGFNKTIEHKVEVAYCVPAPKLRESRKDE